MPTTQNGNCAGCDPQPTPVPAGTIGLFEGADYYHCRVYRPEFNCRMRNLNQPFCGVCQQVIAKETGAVSSTELEPIIVTVVLNFR